jgi:transcriptional regulator NrdR family protein
MDKADGTKERNGSRGIACPACGCRHFRVLYTRPALGDRLLRRRECRHCGRRVTTYEQSLEKPRRGL